MPKDGTAPKDRALDDIRQDILLMHMPPGEPLDEAALCTRFGISRTPFREILRELAGQGYVTLHKNRSARVSDMSHRTLRDFFLVAPMIYAAVLQLAAANASVNQIAQLKAAQADFRRALAEEDPATAMLTNDAFHRITGEMTGNPYLLPSFHRLLIDHARIGMTFFDRATAPDTAHSETAADQHDQMIAAIEAGEQETASKLAHAHWELSRRRFERFIVPSGLAGRPANMPSPNTPSAK